MRSRPSSSPLCEADLAGGMPVQQLSSAVPSASLAGVGLKLATSGVLLDYNCRFNDISSIIGGGLGRGTIM